MLLKKRPLLALIFVISYSLVAQNEIPKLTKKDSVVVSSWMFGLGFNTVDDSGNAFGKVFDIKDAWNAVPYPSRLSIGKYFKNGLGVEGIVSYNKYKKGKIVDNFPLEKEKDYYSIDSRLSYDLNKIMGKTNWFNPYVGIGLGYTQANDNPRGTYNAIFGFRTWFSNRLGLDINTSGKWAINSNYKNHIQHAIGVVYRFNYKEELTKKGKEKLELINALEKEKIRINDSIALVAEIEEKARLEEKLAQEKENARLEQLKKEKQLEKDEKFKEIENSIKVLEDIHFNFDSSGLTSKSKSILAQLASILNKYPELIVEISSHTDSRGSAKYNQILSEKRLQSTINYLLKNEVLENKIKGKAFGEEKLLNECDNNTKCSEKKHLENRRSEIKIVDF